MILKREVRNFAIALGVGIDVVEKDYVLSWILAGINQDIELKSKWIFKGGTCLKKCFFEDYRFSEDLDFTVTDPGHLDAEFLVSKFKSISTWIHENSGIDLPENDFNFELYQNPRDKPSVQGRISYNGPNHRRSNFPRVKIDLTNDELLVTKPIQSKVHHPYSDFQDDCFFINSYSYLEVFAEKLRALVERGRPRDLYDVVQIYRKQETRPSSHDVLEVLTKKCDFKNVELCQAPFFKNHSFYFLT